MIKSTALAVAVFLAFLIPSAHQADAFQCNANSYISSDGHRVHSPNCRKQSRNFAAICRDGSYSHSRHHRGTCSRHGGVRFWH